MNTRIIRDANFISIIALLLFNLGLASSARAQTAYVSTGIGNWSAPSTWNPNGVPGTADSVEIQSGSIVTNDAVTSVGSITVDSGGTLRLSQSITTGWVVNSGTTQIGLSTVSRTLIIGGSLTNNGVILASSAPAHEIIFSGALSPNAVWVGSGDLSNARLAIQVNPGVTLDISGLTSPLKFIANYQLANEILGTLVTGTQVIDGSASPNGIFVLGGSGTLITANTNGLINGSIGTLNFPYPSLTVVLPTSANYIFNGTSAQVTVGLPTTVNNLTISNAAGVTLSSATTITGTLEIDAGVLTTTSSTTPTSAAVTVAPGSYVNGPLAMVYYVPGAQTFPVGKGGNPRSVTLNYTSLDNASTVTVEQFESAMGGTLPAHTAQFGSRYWTISQSGGNVLTYNLALDGTGFTPSVTPVILQQGNPDMSYSTSSSAPNYTSIGLTNFGNFTLGDYAPSADQLVFTTTGQTLTAGATSGTITVQLQDSGGTPKNAASNLTINLTTTSRGGVYRDMSDASTITNVTIPAGNNSVSFKYRDTTAPTMPTITAAATGISPAAQQETVNVAAADHLAFTSQPGSTNLGATLSPVVVQVQDQYGNPVPQSGTVITVTLNNGGAAVLTGTNPQTTDGSGVAMFGDLAVTLTPATGLYLTASGGGLTQAVSSNFNIQSQIIVLAPIGASLNQGSEWFGGVVPGSNDTAQIDNTSGTTTHNKPDVGANLSWYGFNIMGWSANAGYQIQNAAGGVITLGPGGLVGSNLTHSITCSNAFALGANQNWTWGSGTIGGGTLALSGGVNNGGFNFNLNAVQPVLIVGSISGTGGFYLSGGGTVTLYAANTYTGGTLINSSTMVLLTGGSIANSPYISIASNGVLAGNGTIYGTLTNNGTLTPGTNGTTIGTLTFQNGIVLNSGSTNLFKLNKSLAPSNDVVAVTGSIIAGGNLTVTNRGSALAPGDSFTLFSHPVSGSFASLILPTLTTGYAWTNRLAIDGSIAVVSIPVNSTPTNITVAVSGNVLTLSWPADHTGWRLLVQTNNLAAGVSLNTNDWSTVAGSTAINQTNITVNPAIPAEFYRLVYP